MGRTTPQGLREALAGALGGSAAAGGSGRLRLDKTEDGWTLVRDNPETAVVAGANIRGGAFPEGTEDLIGEPMVELILGIEGLLGQRQAEYLMDHPSGIPEELERYALVFPGTVWQSPDQNHQVPCLVNRGGTWGDHLRDTGRRLRLPPTCSQRRLPR